MVATVVVEENRKAKARGEDAKEVPKGERGDAKYLLFLADFSAASTQQVGASERAVEIMN